ncbi:hypothetical protein GCK72_019575 [Caenorhabditis remanei]|uniref:Receptor L-domain domain-containing protein n=1 Tax=Caenorhabditis remanei TaxID=31234 RepID=A0A6A5GF08_CAERE|nr:hypothetical protein GCK72_019575 [Caenorhabditis remanei]KAF1753019.1 hypothetical protein GCK72_019575 [Caenorhabditis remanei]
MNLKPLSFLKKLNGYLRVYETDLEDLSFLENLKTIEFQYTGEYYVDIYGNPNLKKLGLGSLKKSLPADGLPWVNLTNNHPDFCISTNELQAFAEAKAQFLNIQAKLCPDLIRKDKQKVCNFEDLNTMDSNCQHIIGNVIINSENEEHLSKLEKVTHIYGTLTIEDTEKLTDLGFLANFRQVTNLRMDKIPMIRINSNKKLQKIWLPNMKTPPFPNGFDQIIEIDGNSQDIFRDRRECLLFQKLTQTTTKYNKKSCTKLPTAVTTQKEPTILATTPVVFDLISTKSYESGLNFTTIPASSDLSESTTLFAESETTMKSGYSADSWIFSFSLIFIALFPFH